MIGMTNNKMRLIDACRKGDFNKVQELIADLDGKGLDVNYQDDLGYTALMRACLNNHREIIFTLLPMNGIDTNVQSHSGYTALMVACWYGNREIVSALLHVDGVIVSLQSKYGDSALIYACMNGNREIASALLSVGGIQVNSITKSRGYTALMWACFMRYPEIALDLLLDRRVDRHIEGSNGDTALILAHKYSRPTVVTRIEEMDRGDDRMPMLLVHHRYMYADPADTTNRLYPPASAITKALMISGIVELICRYIA
jgi:ankyrin repeat protein